jgi:hypothetical protein
LCKFHFATPNFYSLFKEIIMGIELNPKINPMMLEGDFYPADPSVLLSPLPMIYVCILNVEKL